MVKDIVITHILATLDGLQSPLIDQCALVYDVVQYRPADDETELNWPKNRHFSPNIGRTQNCNNFISARGNLPAIISKLFQRRIAQLMNIFQHGECR